MNSQLTLARAKQQELISQAEEHRVAHQVAQLRRLEKRRLRAERELLRAWRMVEQLRSAMSAG